MNTEDSLFFIERQVPDGTGDVTWETYDSFPTEREAYEVANIMSVQGWTVRIICGANTLHEMAGG